MTDPVKSNPVESRHSTLVEWAALVAYWTMLAVCTFAPWILQARVGWWAGLLSIPLLFYAYDRLFVAKGSLCKGILFGIPLGGAMGLMLLNVLLLAKWILHVVSSS